MLREHVQQLRVGDLFRCADLADARIVNKHIESAELFNRLVNHGCGHVSITDVMFDREELITIFVDEIGETFEMPRCSRDLLAATQCRYGECASKSG
jgi:hypothetical protein